MKAKSSSTSHLINHGKDTRDQQVTNHVLISKSINQVFARQPRPVNILFLLSFVNNHMFRRCVWDVGFSYNYCDEHHRERIPISSSNRYPNNQNPTPSRNPTPTQNSIFIHSILPHPNVLTQLNLHTHTSHLKNNFLSNSLRNTTTAFHNHPLNPQTTTTTTIMPRRSNATVTRTTKPTLLTRLRGRNAKSKTVKTTTTVEPGRPVRASRWGGNRRTAAHTTHATHGHATHAPVARQRRHATIGDKISGAMMKIKGSLTRRPGVKAAGTRRMHGTDGRGSHRVY
ncbi:hypothetical protein VTL71DRAFT_11081 [Oculimacula yallundae]|uniref:Uncharacterized protein n=1 Tax=Oculimacula yallundae TaxID=86028 RepID=A0ABR4CV50_9HELO